MISDKEFNRILRTFNKQATKTKLKKHLSKKMSRKQKKVYKKNVSPWLWNDQHIFNKLVHVCKSKNKHYVGNETLKAQSSWVTKPNINSIYGSFGSSFSKHLWV